MRFVVGAVIDVTSHQVAVLHTRIVEGEDGQQEPGDDFVGTARKHRVAGDLPPAEPRGEQQSVTLGIDPLEGIEKRVDGHIPRPVRGVFQVGELRADQLLQVGVGLAADVSLVPDKDNPFQFGQHAPHEADALRKISGSLQQREVLRLGQILERLPLGSGERPGIQVGLSGPGVILFRTDDQRDIGSPRILEPVAQQSVNRIPDQDHHIGPTRQVGIGQHTLEFGQPLAVADHQNVHVLR